MSRPSGLPKTGGRKKGVRNKKTRYLSEVLTAKGFSVVERLMGLLDKLDVAKRADVLLALLPYMYPRRAPTDTYHEIGEEIQEEFDLLEDEAAKPEPASEVASTSATPAAPVAAVSTGRSITQSPEAAPVGGDRVDVKPPSKTEPQFESAASELSLEDLLAHPAGGFPGAAIWK